MALVEVAYALAMRGARRAAPLVARGDGKLARGVRGRSGSSRRIVTWAHENRDLTRPLLWLHAPSVGEGLQAASVISALGRAGWRGQLVFTHFSPSAEPLAATMSVDRADYLPWDEPSSMAPVVEALRPEAVVFTKTEVWPTLSHIAWRNHIRTFLVAATLPEVSSRMRLPARVLLGPAFRRLDRVLAIDPDDANRFQRLGVPTDRIEVTGDPAVDSAAGRVAAARTDASYLAPFFNERRPTVVAGSTWPADEEVVVDGLSRLRSRHPDLRLIIAPHEPTEGHLAPLEKALVEWGWRVGRLAAVESRGSADEVDAVIVDRVGVLAELYRAGTVGFVGGGFHGAGLHSVLEPAAAGLPVLFGPRHLGSRAAGDLLAREGARVVDGAEALERIVGGWLEKESDRQRWGAAAAGYIEEHRGASDRTASRLLARIGHG